MAEKNTEEKKENVEKLSIRGMIRQATVYLFVIAVSIIFIFILFKWSEIHKAFGGLIKILAPVIAGLMLLLLLLPLWLPTSPSVGTTAVKNGMGCAE